MTKTKFKNLSEYKDFCFKTLYETKKEINSVEEFLGVIGDHDCFDYNDKNEPIDEAGNVLKDPASGEDLEFEDWVNELSFPLIFVYIIEFGFDRHGDCGIVVGEFVSLNEF